MEIDDDSCAGLRIHIDPRDIARVLDGKETEEGGKETIGG